MRPSNADGLRMKATAARLAIGAILSLALAFAGHTATPDAEMVVTAAREARPLLETFGNTTRVPGDRIDLLSAQHVHELGTQAPGTWLSRGSGQEHLTALRSPVLTGPGACGGGSYARQVVHAAGAHLDDEAAAGGGDVDEVVDALLQHDTFPWL